ncbi:hypothetical protein GCM10010358_27810 [Streptomyces minutiscleroticus]|uniref:Uncharacterized protein n=1 Tax=Streptomyces minutiscleroticus TaxID=68238 RepID=A0A918KRJ6_9ACTN|nr:hypothetical protein GCM10010358_27810 [Streptomyces minutiscleroticus]
MDGAERGDPDAGDAGRLDHGGEQHVEFERPAALQVLQGRGAVVADALGAREDVGARTVQGGADVGADRTGAGDREEATARRAGVPFTGRCIPLTAYGRRLVAKAFPTACAAS